MRDRSSRVAYQRRCIVLRAQSRVASWKENDCIMKKFQGSRASAAASRFASDLFSLERNVCTMGTGQLKHGRIVVHLVLFLDVSLLLAFHSIFK